MATTKTGRPVGAPRKYQSVEEMQTLIDAYFEEIENSVPPRPYTITGLALALDMDREGLLRYEGRHEFYDTIKKAREKVRLSVDERLLTTNLTAGQIFWLKNNAGWADKQEIEVKGAVPVAVNISGWGGDDGPDDEESA